MSNENINLIDRNKNTPHAYKKLLFCSVISIITLTILIAINYGTV